MTTLIPEPIPIIATRSPLRRWPRSIPIAAVIGRATEPVLPSVSKVLKSIGRAKPQGLQEELAMGAADLVAEGLVHLAGLPAQGFQQLGEGLAGGGNALVQKGLGIGPHQERGARFRCRERPPWRSCVRKPLATPRNATEGVPYACRGRRAALAQFAVVGPRPDHPAQQPVASAAQLPIDQHQRGTAGADGQGGEHRLDVLARERVVAVELGDGRLDQLAAALRADDHPGADLSQFDHIGHLERAVEQSQAGIRHVVDGTLRREAEAVMDAAGGGRLEEVAPDGAVHQRADVPAVDTGGLQGLFRGLSAMVPGSVPGGQKRRWAMPDINSSRPSGSPKRPYNGASRASISAELTTSSGSV